MMSSSRLRTMRMLSVRALVVAALVFSLLLVAMEQKAFATTSSDAFNRANGSLGANWTDMSVGGLAISNDAVVGTQANGNSGDIYTGASFGSDQFSQIETTSTQLSGSQWIGPAVRAQDGGTELYVGIYWWNFGNPELMLFKLINGGWTQLGSAYPTGPLAAGTVLNLSVTGSTLSFSENGDVVITATDTSLSGGAPGIMANGTSTAGDWSGGDATSGGTSPTGSTYSIGGTVSGLSGTAVLEDNGGDNLSVSANGTFTFGSPLEQGAAYDVTVQTDPSGQACTVVNGSGTVASANVTNVAVTCSNGALSVQYVSTDSNNIQYYSFTSADDGDGPQTLRVLQPTHPAAGVAHNFLYVLPVEAGLGTTYGDGLETLAALDAEDQYNLTIIEPTFAIDPWYANNPNDANLQYETFMTNDLVPWVDANLSTTGTEQNWLIGFSKSGYGAQDLLLKHPGVFQLAASWDFPADMSSYGGYGSDPAANYGTNANFEANYELTAAFVDAYKAPFLTNNRIWIGGYNLYQTDIADYDALLTSEGIAHTDGPSQLMAHSWDSGWMQEALAALYQDSVQSSGGTSPTGSTYSIGGTVSGLSGTAVLEDNGGDNLSVSANGTFTFGSPLEQGAAYDVTVQTDPSGQACTVVNGSGTVASANVTNVAVTCSTQSSGGSTTSSDAFNRANGSLGANWTDMSVGGLAISNDAVVGTQANGNSGDIYTGASFGSDQFSQIETTSTQLSGSQWIGPAVRAQDGGTELYVGIYWWNFGNPELMLFKLINGGWTQLGSAYPTGPLAAGTVLNLSVTGSTLSFSENGDVVITATDTSLSGGAPGIMANGTSTAGDWSGGDATSGGTSPTGSTYSIGGTVSGLSGTAVLEDNGGDNLSVSANGTFTFGSPLEQGAAYDVTVQTDPSGQACTVVNGSGTVASANVTNVAVTCSTQSSGGSTTSSDAFNRANGSLGANWTDMSVGGLAISNDAVVGTQANGNSGDIYTGASFGSDQFSQIETTSTQLSGSQWIGPAVRAQDGGTELYVGIYWWNFGNPELMLFKLINGGWTQLGSAYPTGPLAAGTVLNLSVTGSTLSFSENGDVVITATDTSLSGGAPGIMANGTSTAGDWSGGDATSGGTSPTGSTYSIGGTVSGLSGTAVLEDNGGDNLSVSANGTFTFGSPLEQGAAYDVTVQTDPSGQACTVVNGSGTVASANVTNVAVTCSTQSSGGSTTSSDAFNRANGSLGANWTDMSVGGLAISNDAVVGTQANGNSGDIYTGASFGSDQFSQIETTSTQLSGSQWIGPAVRAQDGGTELYVGIYWWNFGNPELMLFKLINGGWTQLGSAYPTGPLAAGTVLNLSVTGSTLSFSENGDVVITATDTSLSGGAPGIMANGTSTAGDWSGGDA